MNQEIIQFIGLKELEETEQEMVKKITSEYYEKIKRALKNITSMVVHIKEYSKTGKQHKYSLHIRAIAPTKMFESSKASDWDLARVLHKGFKDIEREIQHALRTDEQHD